MTTHRDWTLDAFNEFFVGLLFANDARVLDVGCRDECFRKVLESGGFKWTGLDKDITENKDIALGKMEDLNMFDNESFQIIFVCHAFEHCERPIDALREFRRVLKPGGYLFISSPNPCEHQILKADIDHISVFSPMQLERQLRYTGFTVLKCYLQENDIEQNHNVIAIGRKES